jgi:CRISPR/Cas system-associated protein Csx1
MKKDVSSIAIYPSPNVKEMIKGFNLKWIGENSNKIVNFVQIYKKDEKDSLYTNYMRLGLLPSEIIFKTFNLCEINSREHIKEKDNLNQDYSMVGSGHARHIVSKKIQFYGEINEKYFEGIFSDYKISYGKFFGERSFIVDLKK